MKCRVGIENDRFLFDNSISGLKDGRFVSLSPIFCNEIMGISKKQILFFKWLIGVLK